MCESRSAAIVPGTLDPVGRLRSIAPMPDPAAPLTDHDALARALVTALTPLLAEALAVFPAPEPAAAGAPKRWWQSLTMQAGAVQVLGGLCTAALGTWQGNGELIAVGVAAVGTGVATLTGRANPEIRPIGKPAP